MDLLKRGLTFLSFSTLSKSFYPYALGNFEKCIRLFLSKGPGSGFQLASVLIV
jgi:hypothetical protein